MHKLEIPVERVSIGILQTMECNFYEKAAGYLILFGKTELATCAAAEKAFSNVQNKAQTVRFLVALSPLYHRLYSSITLKKIMIYVIHELSSIA